MSLCSHIASPLNECLVGRLHLTLWEKGISGKVRPTVVREPGSSPAPSYESSRQGPGMPGRRTDPSWSLWSSEERGWRHAEAWAGLPWRRGEVSLLTRGLLASLPGQPRRLRLGLGWVASGWTGASTGAQPGSRSHGRAMGEGGTREGEAFDCTRQTRRSSKMPLAQGLPSREHTITLSFPQIKSSPVVHRCLPIKGRQFWSLGGIVWRPVHSALGPHHCCTPEEGQV